MKSKFFCAAVEGATTDGRVIDADWITQMAANYKPATFTANIDCEHIKGFSPTPPFNNYGHVVAVEKREIDLELNGKTEKKLALFVQVEGNAQLIALSKAGQKRFPSIEVNPNFAGKGQAYLVGLAMTDNPASLGTEMLQFSAKATANPLAGRKQHADNLFSSTDGVDAVLVEFEAEETPDDKTQAFSVEAIVAGIKKAFKADAPAAPAAAAAAAAAAPDTDAIVAAFTDGLGKIGEAMNAQAATFAAAQQRAEQNLGQLQSDFNTMKAELAKTPNPSFSARPDATGASSDVQTDC